MIFFVKTLLETLGEVSSSLVYGVDHGTEALIHYCRANGLLPKYVVTRHMMLSPGQCGNIPSKRTLSRNSFSETELVQDARICGVPVVRADQLSAEQKQIPLLMVDSAYGDEEKAFLRTCGFARLVLISEAQMRLICNEVYDAYDLYRQFSEFRQAAVSELLLLKNSLRRSLRGTVYDFHFEFHLAEHCNLQCRGCTHFSPLAKPEFTSVGEFEKDIFRLSELTGKRARFINLLGGEPLLHPEAERFCAIARDAFPDTTIRLVTNGILLPSMSESFWRVCRETNTEIGVTEYPIQFDYEQARKTVEDHGCVYVSFSGTGARDELWKLSMDEEGHSRPIDNFMNCPRPNACVFCAHGKLFSCATIANAYHFNRYFQKHLELDESDYIDIYQVQSVTEILEFLSNPVPFCRHCNIEARQYGVPWAPSEFRIEEWT